MTEDLGFIHRFIPAEDPASGETLLVLHGTGGDENDLVGIGQAVAPGAAILSPRGNVLENGAPRFFRRLAEGVFDPKEVRSRAEELARFVRSAVITYRLDPERIFALGYSNGANIASAIMLLRPGVLRRGVLLRAMVPLEPEPLPAIDGTRVLISNGRMDPIVSPDETERLAKLLQRAGADVEVHWQPAGHQLMPGDFAVAKTWLQSIE